MKKCFLIFIISLIHSVLFSQSHFTKVDYLKISRPAIENDFPFPEKTIEDAIDDAFSKKGYKGFETKGFTEYKGVRLQEFGNDQYDFYFMVNKKSKRDKEHSTVILMISKGFEDFINESSDGKVFERARIYMDSLRNTVAAYDLEQQINIQTNEVKSAEKKNLNLQDEAKDLEKRKHKLEEQMAENLKDQEQQVKELEKQRQILEVLKSKRKQ